MYTPKHHEERDPATLHALIRAHPFGAWVTTVDGALVVNHIPFLLLADQGPCGMLVGHVARANDVWRRFAAVPESIVGIEIPIRALEGKWKASQNRSAEDRAGVVEGLAARGDDASAALADLVPRGRKPD